MSYIYALTGTGGLMVTERKFSLSGKVIAGSALIIFAPQSIDNFTSHDETCFRITDRKF